MDFIAVYPKIEPKPNVRLLLRTVLSLVLLVACIAVGIINLCVGGRPWALYVFGAAIVCWAVFLYQPMVEFSLLHRIAAILPTVCAYLFLVDWLADGSGFSGLVVPIVLFGVFILCILLFFVRFRHQKHNIFPIYMISLMVLTLVIFAACGLFSLQFNWPMIVLASLDGIMLILTLFVFLKPILRECRKKFHTR